MDIWSLKPGYCYQWAHTNKAFYKNMVWCPKKTQACSLQEWAGSLYISSHLFFYWPEIDWQLAAPHQYLASLLYEIVTCWKSKAELIPSVATFEKSDWQNDLLGGLKTLLKGGRFKKNNNIFLCFLKIRVVTEVTYKRVLGNDAYKTKFLKLRNF